jgi:uncharacterized protein YyaL (SSP411 family)
VDWYPWSDKAFEKAEKEDKPIFLSIGYSTCHWCHVMEKESFEDIEVAKLMNEAFVCIKVDREERPDIDDIYMTVCQLFTGSGGWPLTIIMTPDRKPFFAGTYFPKTSRFGRSGMLEVVPRIREIWEKRRDELLTSADTIVQALKQFSKHVPGEELGKAVLKTAYDSLLDRYDGVHGGFGSAPKFPSPYNLFFLLRYWHRTGEDQALRMVEKTLEGMRLGGMYDHIGHGFHRYSTDERWLLPHFEKMLYDQALIAIAYIEAYLATGKETYRRTATEVLDYVLRDMTSPEGGFHSAEDADSEGVEGKYYLWTSDEVKETLQGLEKDLFLEVFNISEKGNFESETTRKPIGDNIPHLSAPLEEIATKRGMREDELRKVLEAARRKLLSVREKRVRPSKDDKILADWNGLMMAAMAMGARVLGEDRFGEVARRSAEFVLGRMTGEDGELLHRYLDGDSDIPGFLDDYAFLIWGLIELYQASFDISYLKKALELDMRLYEHFWDDSSGGFFFTADDGEALIARPKGAHDGAIPSGNSIALLNTLRLARITADAEFEQRAALMARIFSNTVLQSPHAYTGFLNALDLGFGPTHEVVITGNLQEDDTKTMISALNREFLPNKVVIFRPSGQVSQDIMEIIPYIRDITAIEGKPTAYVCSGHECKAPTTSIDKMMEMLKTGA